MRLKSFMYCLVSTFPVVMVTFPVLLGGFITSVMVLMLWKVISTWSFFCQECGGHVYVFFFLTLGFTWDYFCVAKTLLHFFFISLQLQISSKITVCVIHVRYARILLCSFYWRKKSYTVPGLCLCYWPLLNCLLLWGLQCHPVPHPFSSQSCVPLYHLSINVSAFTENHVI